MCSVGLALGGEGPRRSRRRDQACPGYRPSGNLIILGLPSFPSPSTQSSSPHPPFGLLVR